MIYLLEFHFLCIELLLLFLQLVSLLLQFDRFLVQVLLLPDEMFLKFTHLLFCVSLVLLQSLEIMYDGGITFTATQ